MSVNVEQRIRERAYVICQEEGCPEGCDHQHWFRAEQEVAALSLAPAVIEGKSRGRKKPAAAGAATVAERKPRARKVAVAV